MPILLHSTYITSLYNVKYNLFVVFCFFKMFYSIKHLKTSVYAPIYSDVNKLGHPC